MNEEILVGVAADDRPRARAVLALAREGMASVIQARSIDDLVRACADRQPHVVVHVDDGDPVPGLRRLARDLPRSRLVAVVPGTGRAAVRGALLAGADGVVAAAEMPTALPVTVRAAWAGQTAVPSAARAVLETGSLSPREIEVLDLVVTGLSNSQIAERLCLTEHTVKSHLGSVFTKLRVHSRSEAIAVYDEGRYRSGSSPERQECALTGGTT